jgi:hypothetical protein
MLLLLLAAHAFSQQPAAIDFEAIRLTKIATALRVAEEISVDGRLSESAWRLAAPLSGFLQRLPQNGAPVLEDNDVRIVYDDDNLYVGWLAYDAEVESIGVQEMREDFNFQENESLSVVIDGLHDRRSGFVFATNPQGAKRDAQLSNDGQSNPDWDGVWDVKVSRNDVGWVAEFVIPFKTLRFSNAEVQEWGFNLARKIVRLNEESSWAPTPIRYTALRLSYAGVLTGIENIQQGRNLKVKPYIAGGVTQIQSDGQIMKIQSLSRLKDYDGGVDLKYSLTPQLTLDMTYHTDFAQVEADQQQVNLTRFNLFFPEKRDFFLENSGTFNFGPGGNLVPFFSRAIGLNGSTPVPIIGGARVSGRVNRYDIGFLAMKTDSLQTGGGATLVASNNYVVGRVKRNLLTNSWVGGLVTSRDSTREGDFNRVYGADAHFQFFQRLEFDTYLLKSDTPRYRDLGRNQARRLQSAWRDDEITFSAEYNSVQTYFNPEVGFVRRSDVEQYSSSFSWRPLLTGSDVIRNLSFGTSAGYDEDGTTGKVETRTQEVSAGVTFEDGGSINVSTSETFDRLLVPFPIRPNLPVPAGDHKTLRHSVSVNTNQGLAVAGNGNINWGEFWNGRSTSFGGALGLKVNNHLNVDLNYSHNNVRLSNGKFTTDLWGARFLYGFSPRSFINAFFQYNADTHQFSSNIRFNITHHPLSDLYLVYNDTRDTDRGNLVGRAFIIKLTNLFNF